MPIYVVSIIMVMWLIDIEKIVIITECIKRWYFVVDTSYDYYEVIGEYSPKIAIWDIDLFSSKIRI